MFGQAEVPQKELAAFAHDFDAGSLTGDEAIAMCETFGTIIAIGEGVLAQSAKRVRDTGVQGTHVERDVNTFLGHRLGRRAGTLKDAIATADALPELPALDEAVKSGQLSAVQANLIADAASRNPAAEQRLLDAAPQGLLRL